MNGGTRAGLLRIPAPSGVCASPAVGMSSRSGRRPGVQGSACQCTRAPSFASISACMAASSTVGHHDHRSCWPWPAGCHRTRAHGRLSRATRLHSRATQSGPKRSRAWAAARSLQNNSGWNALISAAFACTRLRATIRISRSGRTSPQNTMESTGTQGPALAKIEMATGLASVRKICRGRCAAWSSAALKMPACTACAAG